MNKYILLVLIFFINCQKNNDNNKLDNQNYKEEKRIIKKESSLKNKTENIISSKNIIYSEQTIKKEFNYENNEIKFLNISFKNYLFSIKYIEDRAYIQYKIDNQILQSWHSLFINFYYDSDFETADKDIHLLYNNDVSEGYILFPSFTEEFHSYFLYKFDKKQIVFRGDYIFDDYSIKKIYKLSNNQYFKNSVFQLKNNRLELILKNKSILSFIKNKNKIEIDNSNFDKDILLINSIY